MPTGQDARGCTGAFSRRSGSCSPPSVATPSSLSDRRWRKRRAPLSARARLTSHWALHAGRAAPGPDRLWSRPSGSQSLRPCEPLSPSHRPGQAVRASSSLARRRLSLSTHRKACGLLDAPELRARFARRHALRNPLSRRLRESEDVRAEPASSFLPTADHVALRLRALIASGEHAVLAGVHQADEELLAPIGDYLRHGNPSLETGRAVALVRQALIADRGSPDDIPLAPRRQPG